MGSPQVRLKLGQRLIEELRPLLDQHGVETETLDGDSKEASLEAAAMRLVKPDSSGQAQAGPSVGAVQANARVDPGASE